MKVDVLENRKGWGHRNETKTREKEMRKGKCYTKNYVKLPAPARGIDCA